MFINESESTCLDMDMVLAQLNEHIDKHKPPQKPLEELHKQLLINSSKLNKVTNELKQKSDNEMVEII